MRCGVCYIYDVLRHNLHVRCYYGCLLQQIMEAFHYKNMKKKDLRLAMGISTSALAKLGKNEHVSTEILTKICRALECDLCDIVELVMEDDDV